MKTTLAIVIIAASACAHGASSIQPGHKLVAPLAQPQRATQEDTLRLQKQNTYVVPFKFREEAVAESAKEAKRVPMLQNSITAANGRLAGAQKALARGATKSKSIQDLQDDVASAARGVQSAKSELLQAQVKINTLNLAAPNLPSKNPPPGKRPPPPPAQ